MHCACAFAERPSHKQVAKDKQAMNTIKEKTCYIAADYHSEINAAREATMFVMPDYVSDFTGFLRGNIFLLSFSAFFAFSRF